MKTISKNKSTPNFNGIKALTGRVLNNESGFAMVTALLLMVVMISVVPAALQLSTGEMDRAGNFKENREAFFVAEAGLEHAKFLTEAGSIRAALAGPDDLVTATPSDSENDDNGTFGLAAPVALPVDDGFVYDTAVLNGNTYYIRAFDNNDGDGDLTKDLDNMVFLSAVGIVDGTTTVQALVYNPPGLPTSAVTTNGDLDVGGDVGGACGSVHANGNLDLAGSGQTVAVNATSSGIICDIGNATVGSGTCDAGQPVVPVPDFDVTEFAPYADYQLRSDGNVYDKNGNFVASSGWQGWSYQSSQQKWRNNSGNDAFDAFLYFEGNVDMSNGSAGTPGNKWELTIVATGYVAMGGNVNIINKKDPALPADIQNLFVVAGTDIDFSGASTQLIEGVVYAREQLKLSGNADIDGAAMAFDAPSTENLVNGANTVSGGTNISYGCGMTVPTTTTNIGVVSWNEIN